MKKQTTENIEIEANKILNANTVVVMKLKNMLVGLGSLITSMLGLFFGFYLLVIQPKFTDLNTTINEQKQAITNLNTAVGNLNGAINGLSKQNQTKSDEKSVASNNSGAIGGH